MDEDYKQSDISKEVERLMDEEGYEFGEAVKEAMSKGYKDGGLMIAIENFAKGGMSGGKTYHQYHDQFVPRDEESMGYANGGGVGSMMQPKKKKNKKAVVQGGVDNYLGKQPQVVAPRKWQSAPDKPATELAYITKAEKDLIIKKNIHGGLEGGPNMGPSGIMSLDSFGDVGGAGASGGDTSAGGGAMSGRGFSGRGPNQSERDFDRQKANQRAALQIAERAQANRLGYNERANIANRTYGPIQKYSGDGFLGGYRNVDPRTGQPLSGLAYAFDKFNPLSLITGLVGGPIAGLFTRGITGLKNKFTDFKNADTLADLFPSLNKLNIGSKKFRDGFNIKDPNKPNQVYDPNAPFVGTGRFTEFDKAKMGNININKPTANITGTNLNDFQIGDPGKYATADALTEANMADYQTSLVDEFTPGGIDRTNLYEDFVDNRDLISETATSPQFNTSLINEFGDNRNINMDEFADNNMQMQNYLTDQANYNPDPFGNPNMDSRVVPEEYGLVGNNTGELTAFNLNNLINNEMNNPEFQLAKVTKQDLARYTPRNQKNLIDMQDYNSALDSGTINPEMTEFEFNKMKEGLINQPGTYTKEDFA